MMILKSKYKQFENIENLIIDLEETFNITLCAQYINFLKLYNVIIFKDDYYITFKNQDISIEKILGFSKKDDEDLMKINDFYLNRIPEQYIAIAVVNESDYFCLSEDGKIYLWQHALNDLCFDIKNPNQYLPQNTDLLLVFEDFDSFISSIFLQ